MNTTRELNEEDFNDMPPPPSHEIDLKHGLSNMPYAPGTPLMPMTTKTLTKNEIDGLRVYRAQQFNLYISTMFNFINRFFEDCKLNAYPPCIKDKVIRMREKVNALNDEIKQIDEQIKQSSQTGGRRRRIKTTRKKRAHKRTNKRK